MRGMLMTGAAELVYLKPILMQFLIFSRRIIPIFANRAFQSYNFTHAALAESQPNLSWRRELNS